MSDFFKSIFGKNTTRIWLATIWSAFAMAFFWHVAFTTIPVGNQHIVDNLQGVLSTLILAGIFTFYFGSSQSSSDKDDTIKNMQPIPNNISSVTLSTTETKAEEKKV